MTKNGAKQLDAMIDIVFSDSKYSDRCKEVKKEFKFAVGLMEKQHSFCFDGF